MSMLYIQIWWIQLILFKMIETLPSTAIDNTNNCRAQGHVTLHCIELLSFQDDKVYFSTVEIFTNTVHERIHTMTSG